MTKKEYILQYVAIGVSFLTVIASVFAGWMAYKASISSAMISEEMRKENEIETRSFEKKSLLYEKLINTFDSVFSGTGNFNQIKENYKTDIQFLKNQLKIYGSNDINLLLTCIDSGFSLGKFQLESTDLNTNNFISIKDIKIHDYFIENILIPTELIKRQIRLELNGKEPEINSFNNDYFISHFKSKTLPEDKINKIINRCIKGGWNGILIFKTNTGTIIKKDLTEK